MCAGFSPLSVPKKWIFYYQILSLGIHRKCFNFHRFLWHFFLRGKRRHFWRSFFESLKNGFWSILRIAIFLIAASPVYGTPCLRLLGILIPFKPDSFSTSAYLASRDFAPSFLFHFTVFTFTLLFFGCDIEQFPRCYHLTNPGASNLWWIYA